MKVCRLPPSHQGYDLSSPSNNRLTENELFGCEFMEPAELNKALRGSSASMSGVKTRFRSKPRSLRARVRLLVRSCSERTGAPELLWSFSDRDVSLATVSKKGETKKTYEVVCQLWRRDAMATSTLHCVISPPRVRCRFAKCVS